MIQTDVHKWISDKYNVWTDNDEPNHRAGDGQLITKWAMFVCNIVFKVSYTCMQCTNFS